MLGQIKSGLSDLNQRIANEAATRADAYGQAGRAARLEELKGRDNESLAAQLRGALQNKGDSYRTQVMIGGDGDVPLDAITGKNALDQAEVVKFLAGLAPAERQQLLARMSGQQTGVMEGINRLLAGDNQVGKISRGAAIGGIGVGTGLGLTAAGKGLMDLMAYLQEGQGDNGAG
jgi:hypothetical protein